MARTFNATDAVREQTPLLVGLMGPSGSGKTYSALRIATGIQSVSGGDIYFIDTEAKRGLHYADKFKFKHLNFGAPFGSLDYLEAIRHCVKQGAGVIVVDSMSHEHEGPGGMLDAQNAELDRIAGKDFGKRQAMTMLAWAKPKADRRALINGILQINANFVFCFRAKNTSKPIKDDKGKTHIVPQGFMPIAGDEFLFEQTLNCLLKPNSGGVPTWETPNDGERAMIKLPEQFRALRRRAEPLDESVGATLAKWAAGETQKLEPTPMAPPPPAANQAANQAANLDDDLPSETVASFTPDEAMERLENAKTRQALSNVWRELRRTPDIFDADTWGALKEARDDLALTLPAEDLAA